MTAPTSPKAPTSAPVAGSDHPSLQQRETWAEFGLGLARMALTCLALIVLASLFVLVMNKTRQLA